MMRRVTRSPRGSLPRATRKHQRQPASLHPVAAAPEPRAPRRAHRFACAPLARGSILHAPGEDVHGYESAEERWRPIHTAESILLSIISMLADPNIESPANIDAAVRRPGEGRSPLWLMGACPTVRTALRTALRTLAHTGLSPLRRCSVASRTHPRRRVSVAQKEFRDDKKAFEKRVKRCVRRSVDDM